MSIEVFIPLTQGKVTVIDFDDFEKVREFKWRASRSGNGKTYAGRTVHFPDLTKKDRRRHETILLHRFIVGAASGTDVDHKNQDTLDNRRSNLRECSRSENLGNQKTRCTNRSGFKGVNWKQWRTNSRSGGAWCARISVGSKRIQLGYFSTAEEAARAYDTAAHRYFGEFAKLNFSRAPQ